MLKEAGRKYYGKENASYGLGGAIPFLKELEIKFPSTQIVALGVGGPNTNFHGPNEGLNLDYCRRLTCALGHIIANITA